MPLFTTNNYAYTILPLLTNILTSSQPKNRKRPALGKQTFSVYCRVRGHNTYNPRTAIQGTGINLKKLEGYRCMIDDHILLHQLSKTIIPAEALKPHARFFNGFLLGC